MVALAPSGKGSWRCGGTVCSMLPSTYFCLKEGGTVWVKAALPTHLSLLGIPPKTYGHGLRGGVNNKEWS